ncbi:MAG: histidine--tRNA ligase [Acidimicrobiaceae bacterium]|nr:histidine--tRNA ligase [Acidimicrobiaceae bacterium]
MNSSFQAPIGTHDVLAPQSALWEGLVATFAQLAFQYGFTLALTPMFEEIGVFNRGIGENSDVATKEMYVFQDRGDRTYALRPEGTASVVRAFIQHQPTTPYKAWYVTPAFRYERPQAGRYRQHHQLGVEAIGTDDPAIDVEVIALAWRFYQALGLRRVRLLINSMGHDECRGRYVNVLKGHLEEWREQLCDEHQKTWIQNPLRVLDCKRESCINVVNDGPLLPDFLCSECANHFASVRKGLAVLGIESTLDPRLVRGFDYYTRTTFEFVAEALGNAQNAIGGGGRYDGLSEQLGGKPAGGIGFGSGIERLLLAREAEGITQNLINRTIDLFVVDTSGLDVATVVVDELRNQGYAVVRSFDARSMKSQMKLADRSGAALALLIGPQEAESDQITIRDLRGEDFERDQQLVAREDLIFTLRQRLKK